MISKQIAMFPLHLLPLPGELVPLHIFEPRYKELIVDAEAHDMVFGIYFSHDINARKVGSLMKLESVIKRYPGGESDIIVRCIDVFEMETLYRTFPDKLYPGGDVRLHEIDLAEKPSPSLQEVFEQFSTLRKASPRVAGASIYQIANELDLDINDRYAFLSSSADKRERLLLSRLRFLIHVLDREIKSRDVFHLN